MKVFEANITDQVSGFLNDNLKNISSYEKANQEMVDAFRINHFFDNNGELETLKEVLSLTDPIDEGPDRSEYGDFQTNPDLANQVTLHLSSKNISPEVVIEPTCGKGSFIVSSLRNFQKIQTIFGVEIYKPYVWETKFSIMYFFLEHHKSNNTEISIAH